MLQEQDGQTRHAEGLDAPVNQKSDNQPLRTFTDVFDGREIDIDHHGVNHHPDKRGDNKIDMGIF